MISESDEPCGTDDTPADLLWSYDYEYGPTGRLVTPESELSRETAIWQEDPFDEYIVSVGPSSDNGSSLPPLEFRFVPESTGFRERYLNGAFIGFSLAVALWWAWSIRTAEGLSATSHSMRAGLLAVSLMTGVFGYVQGVQPRSPRLKRTSRSLGRLDRAAPRMRKAARLLRLPVQAVAAASSKSAKDSATQRR